MAPAGRAVVARIGHEEPVAGTNSEAARFFELIGGRAFGAELAKEGAARLELLHAVVEIVGHEDVPRLGDRNLKWRTELPIAGAGSPEGKQGFELALFDSGLDDLVGSLEGDPQVAESIDVDPARHSGIHVGAAF